MMRNKWIGVVTLATALAACGGDAGETDTGAEDTAAATTPAPAPAPAPAQTTGAVPEGATAEMVAAGQQIFGGKGMCLTCHGPTATGTPLAPNLTDAEWLNISGNYDEIQTVVRNGVPTPKQHPSPMPPMGGAQLSDQEIQQVAAYVYSVSHQGS
jgi:mono/diheme cytochrome c family protein